MEQSQHAWTTGNDPAVIVKRRIAGGGSAEVFEVQSHPAGVDKKLANITTAEVCIAKLT